MKWAKETEENPGLAHRTVSGAPGNVKAELFTFGFLESCSAIIHRTVRCASGATTKKRNDWLQQSPATWTVWGQFAQSQSSTRRRIGQWTVPVRCGTGLSSGPSCQSSNGWNRQNPNGWVTWLAHRTVRCTHRQQPSPTVVLVVGAINTPNHLYSRHPSFQHIAFNTRALDCTPRHKQEIKSPPKSKTTSNT